LLSGAIAIAHLLFHFLQPLIQSMPPALIPAW